jgi:hypothetical protein
MQEISRYDADIDYCPSCKGVWLDRGEIDKIAMAQNSTAVTTETEIMMITMTTITITEGIEGEEAYLGTYLTLTR